MLWARAGFGRALVLVGALLLAALVFVATERARPASTGLGRALGMEPLDAELAVIADTIAVAHRQPDAGQLAVARRAARAAPLDALPYYIVGAVNAPETVARRRTLVAMALHRDPRLRPAWSWTVADRVAANDVPGITRALLRLAVLGTDAQQLWGAIAQLSADPSARAIIKSEIRRGAPWRDTYLAALSSSPVDRAVVFEMLESVGKHAPVSAAPPPPGTPDDRRAFLAALIDRKDYERAYLAWVQWLPAASQEAVGHVFDGSFKGRAALPPFAWRMIEGAGGSAAIDPAIGLSLDYSGNDVADVAQQTLLLSPGRYRVVSQAKFDSVSIDSATSPVAWNLTCLPDGKQLGQLALPLDGVERRIAGAPFEVATACQAQLLALKVGPSDFGKRIAGHIRAVTIEAVK